MVEKICNVKHLLAVTTMSDDFEGVLSKKLDILGLLNSVSKKERRCN
jgi:hypothetical protein